MGQRSQAEVVREAYFIAMEVPGQIRLVPKGNVVLDDIVG
jgi:hypothetical protein